MKPAHHYSVPHLAAAGIEGLPVEIATRLREDRFIDAEVEALADEIIWWEAEKIRDLNIQKGRDLIVPGSVAERLLREDEE